MWRTKHQDSLISKYLKTVHFHELSQRCQPSHGWTIIHISLPSLVDKWDGWMCRTKEAERQFCKKRAGRDGPADIFKYFEPNKYSLSYQRKSLSGDKPEEFPAFDRIFYLRNLRVAALSATELEVRVTLSPCHPPTLSPCHLVNFSTCRREQ